MQKSVTPIDQIQKLGEGFASRMMPTLEDIKSAWLEASGIGGWVGPTARKLHLRLHRLVGSSAQFGMSEIQHAAKAVERAVFEATTDGLDDVKRAHINILIENLITISEKKIKMRLPDLQGEISAIPSIRDARSCRLIYLMEDDPIQAETLCAQVGYFGYTVQSFTDINALLSSVKENEPTAIIMDVILEEGMSAGPDTATVIHSQYIPHIPIIFISESDSLSTRLQAVRARGEAYFLKPVDIGHLIDALDRLTTQDVQQKYRIMIIEDSPTQAKIFARDLESVNMETLTTSDPVNVLRDLNEFNPDLVLMDMYMPYCTGTELASVIRQIDKFLSLPIVFLSEETDPKKQLDAMSQGGDDFLTKPIIREHLVRSISFRAERYRKLREQMVRDGLTGLLNHTMLKDRLSSELLRAGRQNSQVSFAMLDLDHFKLVNDTFSHAAGDQVLKSLARLLTQRMRASDIIGRYGGEEFAIILPDTPGAAAMILMNELRSGFSHILHQIGNQSFTVTFSCGVASFPLFFTSAEICDAADRALYSAKNNGRNCVVSADGINLDKVISL